MGLGEDQICWFIMGFFLEIVQRIICVWYSASLACWDFVQSCSSRGCWGINRRYMLSLLFWGSRIRDVNGHSLCTFSKKCQILFFFGSYFLYFCLTYLLVALYLCRYTLLPSDKFLFPIKSKEKKSNLVAIIYIKLFLKVGQI